MLQSFDYVIVGGGTAGLVLASRLSEDSETQVCVIEAGEDRTSEEDLRVPGFAFKNAARTDMHWMLTSSPQPGALNRTFIEPRGKLLGGSSAANFMILGRGHALEYDGIEKLGNKGWNWKSFLKYMKKSENYTVTEMDKEEFRVFFNPDVHGSEGPIHRTLPKYTTDTHNTFVEANKSIGIPYNPDPARGDNSGVWASNHAIHATEVIRSAANTGYYEPIKNRENLHVITGAHATRILLEHTSEGVVARGVEFCKQDKYATAQANKEVILAAGTYMTPQLLELSGIGDKKILESLGIKPLIDLPGVGKNLRECFAKMIWKMINRDLQRCWVTGEIDPGHESMEVLLNPQRFAKELEEYQKSKTGMLAHTASSVFGMLPLSMLGINDQLIEELLQIPVTAEESSTIKLQKEWMKTEVPFVEICQVPGFMPGAKNDSQPGKHYVSFMSALAHSFSRGTVHISSADPFKLPTYDPCILNNEIDMKIMVHGMKVLRKITGAKVYEGIITNETHPGEEVQTTIELEKICRETILTVFHGIGTASMLPRDDEGVVDANLKVYGTKNLRVVDASILPVHVSAHLMLTVYALAEKAADIIREVN